MEIAEAIEVVKECEEWWDYDPSKEHQTVILDGSFDAKELEAFALLMRHKVRVER